MSLTLRLRELADLKSQGALSEEEFVAAKANLLRSANDPGIVARSTNGPGLLASLWALLTDPTPTPESVGHSAPPAAHGIGAQPAPPRSHGTASASELVLYSDNNRVKVTSTMAIIDSTTYPIVNITSVSAAAHEPSRVWPVVLLLLGLVSSPGVPLIGIPCVVVALIWLVSQKSTYFLFLKTSSGESVEFQSCSKDLVQHTRWAVNEAIARRGW